MQSAPPSLGSASTPGWRAVWTRAHFEQLVFDQLVGKGLRPFLPRMKTWSVRAGRPHQVSVPMFPGYVFLHDALDNRTYVEVKKTRGVVAILGASPDRPATISDEEIAMIERLEQLPIRPHPFLREGARVHIHHGPLAGLEGVLVRFKPRDLLVVSVGLLNRSVAVEVERGLVG